MSGLQRHIICAATGREAVCSVNFQQKEHWRVCLYGVDYTQGVVQRFTHEEKVSGEGISV